MQCPDGNQLWGPGESLWSQITEHVPGSELSKIHNALGPSLVNAYTEVHSEAERWHKRWQRSQRGSSNSSSSSSRAGQASPLADPPAVKELLRAEVKMLLQTLKERGGGRDDKELASRYKPETVDFALGHLGSCYRDSTNLSDPDVESRATSRCSVWSDAEEEIEAMRDKLNVADIDQVVGQIRSVLQEECEALKRLVKHFKGTIKPKCQSQSDKSEPTLAELRELRGAIQMDLELYPSSFAASSTAPSPLPFGVLKSTHRLPAGQRISDETLQPSGATSVLRPHPPLCHAKPRPPSGAPPSKTSASVKRINHSPLSRVQTHGPHRSPSASTGPGNPQRPICNRISSPGPASDQSMAKTTDHCKLSPVEDGAGLHCSTPTPCESSEMQNHIHSTHLSSHHSTHSPSRMRVLSPTEKKTHPAWRSRHINITPSPPPCDKGSHSSKSADHPVSPTEKSKTQNSTCGDSLVLTAVHINKDRGKSSSEGFISYVGSRSSDVRIDRNKNGHFGKDATQQQSLVATV